MSATAHAVELVSASDDSAAGGSQSQPACCYERPLVRAQFGRLSQRRVSLLLRRQVGEGVPRLSYANGHQSPADLSLLNGVHDAVPGLHPLVCIAREMSSALMKAVVV